jgi:hypothetical protein
LFDEEKKIFEEYKKNEMMGFGLKIMKFIFDLIISS